MFSWGVDKEGLKVDLDQLRKQEIDEDDDWVMATWIWLMFAGSITFNIICLLLLICCCFCCCKRSKSDQKVAVKTTKTKKLKSSDVVSELPAP